MSYTMNKNMPRVRRDATDMVRRGYTPTQVGRRYGVGSSTIRGSVMELDLSNLVMVFELLLK